jgi:hypothetical protein
MIKNATIIKPIVLNPFNVSLSTLNRYNFKRPVYVNQSRTKQQRRARYCYLTHCCGLPRNLARSIVGRSDNHIALSLENLDRNLGITR